MVPKHIKRIAAKPRVFGPNRISGLRSVCKIPRPLGALPISTENSAYFPTIAMDQDRAGALACCCRNLWNL
jgi:hypothetical protein